MLQTNKYTIFSMYLTMIIMKSSIKEQQPNEEAICLSYNGNACNFAKISHCRRSIQKIFNCFFQCDDMNEQHWTSFKKKRNTHRRHCFAINQRAIPKLIEKKDRDRKKFFRKKFITWIEILLKYQQSCVMNGGTTTQYFNIERGACQGDPVSEIKGIEIFEHCFLYTAYTDDTTFFFERFTIH